MWCSALIVVLGEPYIKAPPSMDAIASTSTPPVHANYHYAVDYTCHREGEMRAGWFTPVSVAATYITQNLCASR